MKQAIRAIRAWEILDSRGRPTVAARCELEDGSAGKAHAPSGASTGKHEAVELRDGDLKRYAGRGVLRAVANVNEILARALAGLDATNQTEADRRMIELDGTPDKSRLGANAILAVSCAVARAAAASQRIALWRRLAGTREPRLPVPMVNIFSGGHHAGYNIDFQDFMVIPHGIEGCAAQIEAVAAVHRAARDILIEHGYALTGVADEGGWGPAFESNQKPVELLTLAIERAGRKPGQDVSIALDVAASHFSTASAEMIDLLDRWANLYPITSIEDALDQDDWDGWVSLTTRLGRRIQLVGDDLFTTNLARLNRGIALGAANAVLVKMNQIGTLTETLAVVDRAREAGYRAVISARSGETEDDFLADLAVATGAGQIKIGSVTRSERLAKYNRLLEIASTQTFV
ncbi:MAG: phosphopyruvate hydratase [Bryobacteraceae bacterium]